RSRYCRSLPAFRPPGSASEESRLWRLYIQPPQELPPAGQVPGPDAAEVLLSEEALHQGEHSPAPRERYKSCPRPARGSGVPGQKNNRCRLAAVEDGSVTPDCWRKAIAVSKLLPPHSE